MKPLVFDPDRYHGRRRRRGYFEGWYFKLVDAARRHPMAVIPGVYMSPDGANRFAFVMTVAEGSVAMARYPIAAFEADPTRFDVRIGPNRFAANGLTLDLSGEAPWRGALHFDALTPWPVSLRSPGVMGWYAYVPFMECFHGIVSLDHRIAGVLESTHTKVDFTGGRGYTEKDWGRRFPASWVWLQGNHFPTEGTSVTASIAIIPFLATTFGGTIAGLWHEGRLYRFTTYTGARVRHLEAGDQRVSVVLEDRKFRLSIEVRRGATIRLYAPGPSDMVPRVDECLEAPIRIELAERSGRVVFSGESPVGALEAQGDLPRLRALLGLKTPA